MYNEEELLEAVDILVEDYGLDEDYAIELVSEAYNEELLAEGKFMDKYILDKKYVAKRNARRAAKEARCKQLKENYGIFEDEYGDLFIESEVVGAVMDEYDLYEEDAIDLIMECYEEELLAEGLGKSTKNFVQAIQGQIQVNSKKWQKEQKEKGWTDEDIKYIQDDQKKYTKRQGKHFVDDVRPAAGVALGTAAVGTSAVLAAKAYKNHLNKKRRLFGKRRPARRRRRR